MTRFMITLEQGVDLVWYAFKGMVGGEIYLKNIPSIKVTDVTRPSLYLPPPLTLLTFSPVKNCTNR